MDTLIEMRWFLGISYGQNDVALTGVPPTLQAADGSKETASADTVWGLRVAGSARVYLLLGGWLAMANESVLN